MRKYQALLLVFILIISCNNNSHIPAGVIEPPRMQNIFWDLIRGDLLVQELIKKDSTKNIKNESYVITEKILVIHHTNRGEFEKSMAFYSKHPEILKTIFDSLSAKQARKSIREEMRERRIPSEIEKGKKGNTLPHFPAHFNKTP